MLTRSMCKLSQDYLISATRICNTVKNDQIIDYLDLLNKNKYTLNENLEIKKRKFINECENNYKIKIPKTSFDYIVENGYIFENKIITQIKSIMKEKNEINNYL